MYPRPGPGERDPVAPGQRSVWDFPRPPAHERSTETVEVVLGGVTVARTTAASMVLETSHPPTYYLPARDFLDGALRPAAGSSWCEWKGRATYLDVLGGDPLGSAVAAQAAWTYPDPTDRFAELVDHVALYPAAVDRCLVDGVEVRPQPGGFYGGWIVPWVAGPFKGGPGTGGW